MHIGILEGEGFSPRALEMLSGVGQVEVFDERGSLADFLANKEILFIRLGRMIDADFLDSAPRLQVVCSPTTGHDHLDEEALASRSIRLISLRGERAFLERIRATPEHTLGLILALLRRYRTAFLDLDNAHWDRDRCRGEELFGMRVGLIGMGRVGRIVADYLLALGARVAYTDPRPEAVHAGCTRCDSLAGLLRASALVVMCASYARGASPLLDAGLVGLLEGKYFVNTARGELVDEAALLESACQGKLKGLATDVIANEAGHNRLNDWLMVARGQNVIITPHIGGATWASMAATEEFIVEKLLQQIGMERE